MPSRSQRHLQEFYGLGSDGTVGSGAVVAITSPTAGAATNPVTLTATASNDTGADVSKFVSWSSNVDGALGTGSTLVQTLSAGGHTLTATVGGISASVAITGLT